LIKKITESVDDNILKVVIECNIREYAKHPIKILTTEKIIDIIKNKYNIVKTLKSPNKKVGNTKKNYITNSGTWVFEILLEQEKENKNGQKTSSTPAKKRSTTTRKKTTSSSIRGRMSKLATKEN
tara:strand:- start:1072 stop:1446 length:375 start_codon:yes stop_codon:yes gene_type:complete